MFLPLKFLLGPNSGNSPNPDNDNLGNVIGDPSSSNKHKREDSNNSSDSESDSDSSNNQRLKRYDYSLGSVGNMKFLDHESNLCISKLSDSKVRMEKLLEKVNTNYTKLVKVVKSQGNTNFKDIVINDGRFFIKNGIYISNKNLKKIEAIFNKGQE